MITRIGLEDNVTDACVKMAEGNIGAASCLVDLVYLNPLVDPDSALGYFSTMISLDSAEIYGTDLYILFDICGKNHARMIAVMRAVQLGKISGEKVKDACSRQDRSGYDLIDVKALYKEVKDYLPSFDPKNMAEID